MSDWETVNDGWETVSSPTNPYKDIAQSAGQGVVNGFMGISNALRNGYLSIGFPVLGPFGQLANFVANGFPKHDSETTRTVNDFLGNLHKPQTEPGKYAMSAAEGGTQGAFLGPAGIVPGLVAGLGGQAGHDVGAPMGYPNAGRAVGSIIGGLTPAGLEAGVGAVAKPLFGNNAQTAARSAMDGMTDADFANAQAMQQKGQATGVPLSGAEATGNPQLLGMQRTLEQQPGSAPILSDFYKNRPQQVQTAANTAQAPLGPSPSDPALVGRDTQGAAQLALKNAEQQRTNSTAQAYANADTARVNPKAMQGLLDRFDAAIASDKTGTLAPTLQKARDMLTDQESGIPLISIPNLDRAKKAIRDMADVPPFGAEPGAKEASKYLKNFAAQLDGIMKTSKPYAEATADFAAASPQVNNKIAGTVGALTKTVDPVTQWKRLVDPELSRPGTISDTAQDLIAANPDNYRKLVKLGIENEINSALKVTQNPGNQNAGARIATAWYSTPQRLDNMREVVANLPNGGDALAALDNVMEVLRQTGYRQTTGSPTASNAANVGALGPSSMTNFEMHPMKGWGENLDVNFTTRSAKNLAKILTDPDSVSLLKKIADFNPGEPYARPGIISILNGQDNKSDQQQPIRLKKGAALQQQAIGGVRG